MDLRSILALAQQQSSIPGLLSMLRGGDVQGGGGGGRVPMQGSGQARGSGQLQMAQAAMDGGGGGANQWAPQWVKDTWNSTPADSTRPSDASGEAQGFYQSQLAPQYNPANWGPPPALNEEPSSWFPSAFNNRDPSYNKFWTMKDYDAQRVAKYGGSPPAVGDERANTFNYGGGNFMVLGHQINPAKLQYDLHRPISDPATAGSIHGTRLFGPDQTAWSTTGELGLPGQIEPFAAMWGAGGPG